MGCLDGDQGFYRTLARLAATGVCRDWGGPMSRGLRVMFYDVSENRPVGWTWKFGAWLYKLLGWFDAVKGVRSWHEAFAWLEAVSRGKTIADLRFWGHGNNGRAYIGGAGLSYLAITRDSSPYHAALQRLLGRFTPTSLIWFRTCGTFGGVLGQKFAAAWSRFYGCRVAGQTFIIHYFHSGTHSLLPTQSFHWSTEEGAEVVDGKRTMASSNRRAPNTLRFFNRKLPLGW